MSSATEVPFIDTTVLSAAATAELEDWGPLEEATDEDADAGPRAHHVDRAGGQRSGDRDLAVHGRAFVLGAGG